MHSAEGGARPRSLPRGCIPVVILLLPVVWFIGRATDIIGTPFGQQRFDAATWRAAKTRRQRQVRATMVGDLIDHYLKPGMPESAITALLGHQDKTWPRFEYSPPEPHDVYEYNMGTAPMDLAGQSYVFRLYFDAQDRYERAEITRD